MFYFFFTACKKEEFDFITVLDVLEHIPKEGTIAFLKSLYGSLKQSGRAILQVPNLQAIDGQLHHFNDFTHLTGYVEHSLRQVLLASGPCDGQLEFYGFETFIGLGVKVAMKKVLRQFYWKRAKFRRKMTGNLNVSIMHPVFYAVVSKNSCS